MPAPRIAVEDQIELAVDDLVQIGRELPQLEIARTAEDQVEFRPRNGRGWSATVVAYDAVGDGKAAELLAAGSRDRKVVVANRISEPARRRLADAGWSWVDRRIGAHIAADGRDIDVIRPAAATGGSAQQLRRPTPAADGPIRGRAGVAYAAAALCSPGEPPSFRSVAAAVGMSPTAISNAVARLADAGLVERDNRPTVPELFWTLAEVWAPTKIVPVATRPDVDQRGLQPNVRRLDEPGWALGGDLAAIELGAPLFATETVPWLWVPTLVELRRAERVLQPATWETRAAVLAVPPTPLVCRRRRPPAAGGRGWPLPHPVFAALDLAQDAGRGREILDQWTPDGAARVWG